MKTKITKKHMKGIVIISIAVLMGAAILYGTQLISPTEPPTDPNDLIILGTFNKNVAIGDKIYMQGTQINFPNDEMYSFSLIAPSGAVSSWGYKSTATNPSGIVPFNFYVSEFGEHTFTMVKTGDGSFVASEKFILVDKNI